MTSAERIIAKFGGVRPMAAVLHIPPTTVQGWKNAGLIPSRRANDILTYARQNGIELSPEDFFEPAEAT